MNVQQMQAAENTGHRLYKDGVDFKDLPRDERLESGRIRAGWLAAQVEDLIPAIVYDTAKSFRGVI